MAELHGIDDLAVALRELGDVLQPVRVAATLRGVRIDERTLAPYLDVVCRPLHPQPRPSRRVVRADRDLLEKDARSAIHDHADSDCAFVLQTGSITCENFRVAYPDGVENAPCDLRHTSTRTLREGEIDMRSGHSPCIASAHATGAR